jgi:hypothetical protein
MKEFFRCYEEAAQKLGAGAEAFPVVENVERHRRFWRPSKVRFLLLAESHVFTHADECVPMRPPELFEPRDTPESFVRFVYCLGYGETKFVGHTIGKNSGTPQYWKIFASCLRDPADPETFAPVLKTRNRVFRDRIKAKADLLCRLRDHGIWLVDASILALYRPGGAKPDPRTRDKLLSICWDRYIANVIHQAKSERIVVIGKRVGKVLEGRLRDMSGGTHIVVSQPQDRMSAQELQRTHQTYYQVCRGSTPAT